MIVDTSIILVPLMLQGHLVTFLFSIFLQHTNTYMCISTMKNKQTSTIFSYAAF